MKNPTPHQKAVYYRSLLKKSRDEIEKNIRQKEKENTLDWTYEMDVKFIQKDKQFDGVKISLELKTKKNARVLVPQKKIFQTQQPTKNILSKGMQFPKIPNLCWEEVKITFITREIISVESRKIKKKYRYSEIGFKDNRKTDEPDSIWDTFLNLACAGGEISYKDKDNVPIKGKSIVKLLRHRLKHLMQIKEDPFCPYKKENSYKVKFILNASPEVMDIVRG